MIGTAPENEGASVPILRARRRCHPVPLAQTEHNLCDGARRNTVAEVLVFMRTVLRTCSMRTRFTYNLTAAPAMTTAGARPVHEPYTVLMPC